ncbi:MAG TPA: ATPase, T2SS/T4P/T4SS family, partial [Actinomycetes bacterium]
LSRAVSGRLNILVSGGAGAGKTTTLNVLSSWLPVAERIVTIEDAAELQLRQPHWLRLEYRPPNIEGRGEITIRDLVRNALRMRPDRIVVGEVRGGEALDMLQAMNTGHDGSLTTVHANSPRDVLSRLETMVLMAGVDIPMRAIREQIASAINLIVHQARLKDGSRRLTHVTEIVGMEGDVITLQDIYVFDYRAGIDENGRFRGTIQPTGLRPRFLERLSDQGVHFPSELFQNESGSVPLAMRR